jgi:hypothetical protein
VYVDVGIDDRRLLFSRFGRHGARAKGVNTGSIRRRAGINVALAKLFEFWIDLSLSVL